MVLHYPIIVLIFTILYFLYYQLTKKYDYWRQRNVPHQNPSLLFGNYKDYILLRKYSPKIAQDLCRKFPDEPYVGTFYGTDPALIVKDPSLIKLVMTKDFGSFHEREISQYTHNELLTQTMFFIGGDTWKVLRQNLTSLFTSAKLKNMFHLIESCASSLETVLSEEIAKNSTIETKSLLVRYTMDCIGNCAFGINTGTLAGKSQINPFTVMGEKIINVSNASALKMVSRSMWPAIFYGLGLKVFDPAIDVFFKKLLTDVFEGRQYKETSRNDFVDLILSWKKKKYLSGDSVKNASSGAKEIINIDVDDNLLIGQCVLFFAAGFETTSTTISFLLYELAKNKDAQARVIEEVDDYYRRHDGKIEYECINEMPFLQACIDETLRLYPVLGLLTREVTEEYTLPTGLSLETGTRIHIPVYDLHHNPEYFPDPEEFRPERFYGEEKKNVKPFTYMPFGEGPRLCIGLRFAKMPIVAAVLTIFKDYTAELADGMPLKLELQPKCIATQATCGIMIKYTPRKA